MIALVLPRWVPFLVVSAFALGGAMMLQEASESATLFPSRRPEHAPGTLPAGVQRNVDTQPVSSRDEVRRRAIEETSRREAWLVARRRVNVTMYATTWCSVCERARHYMNSQGISFVEHDVENSRSAGLRYRELNPRGGVPTLDVDGAVLVGFTPQALERAVDTAAKARIARTP